MALQDLTPQLRTRLSRMERAVGWFVLLATVMLVFGFGYYVYHTAQRKGWFVSKATYFTFTDRATGLYEGDLVKLMGFPVGQITRIDAMPPYAAYNVYVEFEIKDPYNGYIWTAGSRAKVNTADFLGKRVLEITKGTDGYPAYMFNPFRVITLSEAQTLTDLPKWQLAQEIFDAGGTNLLIKALAPLTQTNLALLATLGVERVRVLDTRETKKNATAVWNEHEAVYDPYGKTNMFWLLADESPAVTERLEKLVAQVEKALPDFLGLTNQLMTVLSNSANLTANLDAVALSTRPAVSNLTTITAQLRERGSLGDWLVPSNVWKQLETTLDAADKTLGTTDKVLGSADKALATADKAIVNVDTNLAALIENLGRSLNHLADITSNLNQQVQANTNILSDISAAVVHTDDLVQGLKRHWLLRSAFRSKAGAPATNSPPSQLRSPRDQGHP